MRYRKILEHLKQQNWIAIVLDLLIVIVGVVIAMELSSWQHRLKDKEDQEHYLQALRDDLSVSLERIEKALNETELFTEHQSNALGILEGQPLTNDNRAEFKFGLVTLGMYSFPQLAWSHYEEMKASGMLRKLDSRNLKSKITAAYDKGQEIKQYHTYLFNYAQGSLTSAKKHYSSSYVITETQSHRREIYYNLEALRNNEKFIHEFRNLHSYQTNNQFFIQQLKDPLSEALTAIEDYLSKEYPNEKGQN